MNGFPSHGRASLHTGSIRVIMIAIAISLWNQLKTFQHTWCEMNKSNEKSFTAINTILENVNHLIGMALLLKHEDTMKVLDITGNIISQTHVILDDLK
jgi:hypothetical protein